MSIRIYENTRKVWCLYMEWFI